MVVKIKELKENKNGVQTLFFPKTHADAVMYDSLYTLGDMVDQMKSEYDEHNEQTDKDVQQLWSQWNSAIKNGVSVVINSGYAREIDLATINPNWVWLSTGA